MVTISFSLACDLLFKIQKKMLFGPVNLTSIPSWGKLSKMQIFLLVFINPMDSLSKEILYEADCSIKKKRKLYNFFFLSEVCILF